MCCRLISTSVRVLMLVLLSFLAVGSMLTGQDQPPPRFGMGNNRGDNIRPGTPEEYANVVAPVLQRISNDYHFEHLTETALAGRAVQGLYRACGVSMPEGLARDPDHYFEKQPGSTLSEKLLKAREALKDQPGVRGDRGIHTSLHAVFQSLDVFSNYSLVDVNTRRLYEHGAGIGLHLEDRPLGGSYFVRNIDIDSPSHKQGIRPGDELLEIEHVAISPQTTTAQVNAQITVQARKQRGVMLTVRSLAGEKKNVEVSSVRSTIDNGELMIFTGDDERETSIKGYRPIEEGDWDFWVDRTRRIAVLRLGVIQSRPNRIVDILHQLREDGMKGLVLDLRDCPSGVPEWSADLAGIFLEANELIAKTNYRNPSADEFNQGTNKKEFRSKVMEVKRFLDTPIAVLVGPDTSGAAELIAAALQDHERAKIIGERTRGKSTIQQPSREPSRVQFSYRLTVGVFTRPTGKNLHRMPGSTEADDWGVRPDVEVRIPASMRRQVRAWWFEQDTRPVDSVVPTKLDDIRNDPVLEAAIKVLCK